jgi:hypothetical protein
MLATTRAAAPFRAVVGAPAGAGGPAGSGRAVGWGCAEGVALRSFTGAVVASGLGAASVDVGCAAAACAALLELPEPPPLDVPLAPGAVFDPVFEPDFAAGADAELLSEEPDSSELAASPVLRPEGVVAPAPSTGR